MSTLSQLPPSRLRPSESPELPSHALVKFKDWMAKATFVPGAAGGRGGGPDANSLFDSKGNALPAMDALGADKGSR